MTVYYHSTLLDSWNDHICHQGLLPQPILDPNQDCGITMLCQKLGKPSAGLWVWPEWVVSESLFQDFMVWKWARNGKPNTAILRLDIDYHNLLSCQLLERFDDHMTLSHTLTMWSENYEGIRESSVQHHVSVVADIYLEPVPIDRIQLVRTVDVNMNRHTPLPVPEKDVNYEDIYNWASKLKSGDLLQVLKGEMKP